MITATPICDFCGEPMHSPADRLTTSHKECRVKRLKEVGYNKVCEEEETRLQERRKMAEKRFDVIGQMIETGEKWELGAVVNGVYAANRPVPPSSDHPDGWETRVIVCTGSLEPNSRFVFMGPFPEFPARHTEAELAEMREIMVAKELLERNGYTVTEKK